MAKDADGNYYYDAGTINEQFDNIAIVEDSDGKLSVESGSVGSVLSAILSDDVKVLELLGGTVDIDLNNAPPNTDDGGIAIGGSAEVTSPMGIAIGAGGEVGGSSLPPSEASGLGSFAVNGGTASGSGAFSFQGTASAQLAVAYQGASASSTQGFAIQSGTASGISSFAAIGGTASGENSLSLGGIASGKYSAAFLAASAGGEASTAFANSSAAPDGALTGPGLIGEAPSVLNAADYGIALMRNAAVEENAARSMAIGDGATVSNGTTDSFAFGTNATVNTDNTALFGVDATFDEDIKVGGEIARSITSSDVESASGFSGTFTVEVDKGNNYVLDVNGDTTIEFSGASSLVNDSTSVSVVLKSSGGPHSISWDSAVTFGNTTTVSTIDTEEIEVELTTYDGGSTWRAVERWRSA